MNPNTAPDPSAGEAPLSGMRLAFDRTAVLVVGLIAGFAVGIAFRPVAETPVAVRAVPAQAPVPAPEAAARDVAAAPVDPRVVRRVAADGTIRVGVLGDSFGMGLWDALYRRLPASDGYDVLRFARQATGFTRYRSVDMDADARAQLARDPVDMAVIVVGLNDATDMWDGRLYPFMSEGWKQVVGARIDRFVATAGSTGATVYWLGLPAMRDPALDAKVQALNAFYAERMRRLGVPFFATRALSVGADGRYASHLPDAAGVPRPMRTGDGMHMIGIGYERIARDLLVRMEAEAKRIRAAAGRPAAPASGA